MTFFIALMVPVRRRGVGVAMAAFSDLPTITTTMRRTGPAFLRSLSRRTATTDTAATDSLAEFRNKNNLDDQVFSAISGDGGIKVTVATVTLIPPSPDMAEKTWSSRLFLRWRDQGDGSNGPEHGERYDDYANVGTCPW